MNEIFHAAGEAARLITNLDVELVAIVVLSLKVSITAVVIATVIGLPLGALVGVARFRDAASSSRS